MRTARVGHEQLHRRHRRDLFHRPSDDVVGGVLLVRHLERFDELRTEVVALSLQRELLLELHAVGDVARVQHDAAHVPVVPKVGDVRLEMPPLAGRVAHAEDELLRRWAYADRVASASGSRSSSWTNCMKPCSSNSDQGLPTIFATEPLA